MLLESTSHRIHFVSKFRNFNKMVKRSNPYNEDFVPQSKVHVGIKQINNNEERLQKVYEKTLDLLFRGAKNKPAKGADETMTHDIGNRGDGMKQLFLGKDGHLMQSGTLVKHLSTQRCSCGSLSLDRCAYCEKTLCGSCQHPCECCNLSFCAHCSILRSEGCEVCVSCY